MKVLISESEFRYYAKRLRVALETVRVAISAKQLVQLHLRDVSERRMPQVVRERGGFHYVRVYAAQRFRRVGLVRDGVFRETAGDLGDF